MDHPSKETLKRFAAGTASPEEGRAIVAHLVKGCADCARKLKSLMEPNPVVNEAYDDALQRFGEILLEAEARRVEEAKVYDLRACRATASAALRAASGSPR